MHSARKFPPRILIARWICNRAAPRRQHGLNVCSLRHSRRQSQFVNLSKARGDRTRFVTVARQLRQDRSRQRFGVVWSLLNRQSCQFVHFSVLEPPSCSGVMCLANTIRVQGEHTMLRTMFAMTVAGLLFAAVSGTSQAAPIAPLPSGVTKDSGGLTQVYYHHRHCWVGRYGHMHCGY